MNDSQEAYEKKLEGKMKQLEGEILKLKGKAEIADGDARIALNDQIEAIEKRKAETDEKLTELGRASKDSWEDLKAGVERAADDLNEAVRAAISRFSS